jgi:AcrR family transcriptional regulator
VLEEALEHLVKGIVANTDDVQVRVKRLRDRQAEATRNLIVSVARELFTAQGYAGTSIEHIARRAGVAKGALYHHFNGKDALLRAVYEAVLREAPENAEAHRGLARAYAWNGDADRALAHAGWSCM